MAQIGSLKVVELTKQVDDLNDVPYMTFGQRIQSERNTLRYYQVISQLVTSAASLARGTYMPLPNDSHINILVDDPDLDFFVPKYITFPGSGDLVKRFGTELLEVQHAIEKSFLRLIKDIRAELKLEGDNYIIPAAKLAIGADENITVDPRRIKEFITSCAKAIGVYNATPLAVTQRVAGNAVYSYNINLPQFRKTA